jgi:hypothetical protein
MQPTARQYESCRAPVKQVPLERATLMKVTCLGGWASCCVVVQCKPSVNHPCTRLGMQLAHTAPDLAHCNV